MHKRKDICWWNSFSWFWPWRRTHTHTQMRACTHTRTHTRTPKIYPSHALDTEQCECISWPRPTIISVCGLNNFSVIFSLFKPSHALQPHLPEELNLVVICVYSQQVQRTLWHYFGLNHTKKYLKGHRFRQDLVCTRYKKMRVCLTTRVLQSLLLLAMIHSLATLVDYKS